MNKHINRILYIPIGIIIVFTVLLIISVPYYDILYAAIIYAVCVICTFVMSYYILGKRINKGLTALSNTIENLIAGNISNDFSQLDDNILSKLQAQLHRLNNVLLSHKENAVNQNKSTTKAISDINHQLKTPLTNLNIYINLLKNEDLSSSERKKYIANIDSQITKLNWLMDSLMKLTALETSVLELNKKRQPLIDAVLRAIEQVELSAEAKNIDIKLTADENISCQYDMRWITESIFNILDNAVKYSKEASVIKVEVNKYELFCYVKINDSAEVIEKEQINKIFDRFYRGENTGGVEGTGLGLYIAREIICRHNGYIKVNKAADGNVFGVYLPIN